MKSPDDTPLMTPLDRHLYAARTEPDTAKALAAYRQAYLEREVAQCEDCTLSICRAEIVPDGQRWTCTICAHTWTIPHPHENRWWRLFGFVMLIISALAFAALVWPIVLATLYKAGK